MREAVWKRFFKKFKFKLLQKAGLEQRDSDQISHTKTYTEGIEKLRRFYRFVLKYDKKKFERHQYDLIGEILPNVLKWALGINFFNNNKDFLEKKFKLLHKNQVIVVVLKRQCGKTEFLVRILIGALVSFPNVDEPNTQKEWTLVSHVLKHTEQVLMRIQNGVSFIKDFLVDSFTGFGEHGFKTRQTIKITNKFNTRDKRIIQVFGGNLDGLAAKDYFIDELFKIRANFPKDVLPQLQVKRASLIGLTTLKERSHWSMAMLIPNPSLHLVYQPEICKRCLKLPFEQAIKCPHMKRIQTSFINPEIRENISKLLSADDRRTEMYNIMPDAYGRKWPKSYLQQKLLREAIPRVYNGEFFMFVDPSMTSAIGSQTASVIMYEDEDGNNYLCSLNSSPTPSNDHIVDMIVADLKYFFESALGRYAQMVFLYVESNTVYHDYPLLQKFKTDENYRLRQNLCFVRATGLTSNDPKKKRFGVKKGAFYDELFYRKLCEKFVDNRLYIHRDCITRNQTLSKATLIEMMVEQFGNVRVRGDRITSKYNNNKKQVNDDIYIAYASLIFNIERLKNPVNRALRKQYEDRKTIEKVNITEYMDPLLD